jgi:prophage regulatory protein
VLYGCAVTQQNSDAFKTIQEARMGKDMNKERIIREPEREQRTQLSRTTWWRKERNGQAPRRVPLGDNSVGWLESEIDGWIAARAAQRK